MKKPIFATSQSSNTDSATSETGNKVPWLSDVSRAAQHLTRLTLESSAQAALITQNDKLWAYAGQLPQSATTELAETVSRYWDRQEENDLVRFVRLASTDAEHMLYATRLDKDMVLALVFDAETPFSTIRTQANQLVHSLADSPVAASPVSDQAEDDVPQVSISEILTDIPSPNPTYSLPQASVSYSVPVDQPAEPDQTELPITDLEKTVESAVVTRKSRSRRHDEGDLGETRPNSVTEMARKIVLEPVSPSVYNLDYACMLVPRFAQHHLTGDLSDKLSEWVQQTCIAFAWRLEYISVRPEYLLWIANVPPANSPGYLMRIMRKHTSDKIFADFSRFKKENPSGDFWAPGYLMLCGSQPPPAQLIKDFISQTRQRQGIPQQLR
jgi:REP element-mobilizing transposase RayT